MQHHSVVKMQKRLLMTCITWATRNMEMKSCTMALLARNLKLWFSLDQLIIKDWSIWLVIKCIAEEEVQFKSWLGNQQKVDQEMVGLDSEKWKGIVWSVMEPQDSWKREHLMFQINTEFMFVIFADLFVKQSWAKIHSNAEIVTTEIRSQLLNFHTQVNFCSKNWCLWWWLQESSLVLTD